MNLNLTENDIDTIKVSLRKCIRINKKMCEDLKLSSSPQSEVMEELLNKILKEYPDTYNDGIDKDI